MGNGDAWERRFENLAKVIGDEMALFCMCAVRNIPYSREIEYETLRDYVDKAKNVGVVFTDGVTDARFVLDEPKGALEKWKTVWGVGNESNPYTEEDYRRLDTIFNAYASRLERAGGMDALQDDTLRVCSKMRLEADKALTKGGKENISIASSLNKMIQDNLSAEQLRKKDAKHSDVARIDGIVEALGKKYGVTSELTARQALDICARWMASKRYPMTMDAAEHVIMSIINCTRSNSDLPEITEVPEYVMLDEKFSDEFEEKPNENEDEVYKYLKLIRRTTVKPVVKSVEDIFNEKE